MRNYNQNMPKCVNASFDDHDHKSKYNQFMCVQEQRKTNKIEICKTANEKQFKPNDMSFCKKKKQTSLEFR